MSSQKSIKQNTLELLRDITATADEIGIELDCDRSYIQVVLNELVEDQLMIKEIINDVEYYTSNYDKMSIKVYQSDDDLFDTPKKPQDIIPKRDYLVAALFGEVEKLIEDGKLSAESPCDGMHEDWTNEEKIELKSAFADIFGWNKE